MKTRVLSLILSATLLSIAAPKPAHAYVGVGVSVGFFYNELSPYGRWVASPYGDAWVPAAAAGWQPYADGEWIWTEYGWTWVSYDPWPDDPFHYGSWYWDAGFGWAWVPGFVWAPSWVTWCYGDGFVGWAPLPPTFAFGVSGYSGGPVVAARAGYVFVPGSRFADTRVTSVRMPAANNGVWLARGRAVTSFGVAGGVVTNTALPVSRVRAAMGRAVPVRSISAARTDPRPIPRISGGRVGVSAQPAVLRSEFAARGFAAGTRNVSSSAPRNRSRIVITNRGGGRVRTSVTPGPPRGRYSSSTPTRVTGGPVSNVRPSRQAVVRRAPAPVAVRRVPSEHLASNPVTRPAPPRAPAAAAHAAPPAARRPRPTAPPHSGS